MSNTLKLLVVDDHVLFVSAIKHVLAGLTDDVEIIDANDCENALRLAELHDDLALVLLDLNMPGMHGLEALKVFSERFPLLPIVALTASDERSDMQQVIDEGAMGYIHKSTPEKIMLSALQLVLSGGVYIPREMVQVPTANELQNETLLPAEEQEKRLGLTPRQFDVLCYMLGGHANKVIARQLNLTEATIKAHATGIMKTLNVQKRAQVPIALQKLGINITTLAR